MSSFPAQQAYMPARRNSQLPEPAQQADYVSVFQKFSSFDDMFRGAEMFAASLFVPKEFQGRPENCMIAMDLAFSLGIKPTAIFPHLYVIQGRPALSAQFMIALVNRSGQFSRIQWDEGVDGFVEYERFGKTHRIPNYWAQAKFTELATGETYYSTRVDLELARSNGWLSKNESKWQTIPREMCRWRSASWLAKNYCPEAILGLDMAEEVADYDATPEPARLTRRPTRTIIDAETVAETAADVAVDADQLEKLIAAATNNEELQNAGAAVAAANVSDAEKERLRRAFRIKNAQLAEAAKPQEDATTEPIEEPKPAKKPAAKKTAAKPKQDAPTPEPAPAANKESSLSLAIENAKSQDDLRRVYDALDASAQMGEIDADAYEAILGKLNAKAEELANGADDEQQPDSTQLAEPTRQQAMYAKGLIEAIDQAQDANWVNKHLTTANEYVKQGHITREQYNELVAYGNDRKKKLMI